MVSRDAPLTDAQVAAIREEVKRYVSRQRYTQAQVAHKVGTNQVYVSNFLSGKLDAIPAGTLQKLAFDLNEWIRIDARRAQHRGPSELIMTAVAKRSIEAVRLACETSDIAFIYGPSGIGKSRTLEELTKIIPNSVYMYLTTETGKRGGLVRLLYSLAWETHGAPDRPRLGPVLERLKDSDRLLMLDNVDVLEAATFPIITALHDVAKVPVVLVGTHLALKRLTADADPLRGQMASRIGMRIELLAEQTSPKRGRKAAAEWISADEIRRLYERGRIRLHRDVVDRLKQIANFEIGRLRRCERLVRYAAILANQPQGTIQITSALLDEAMRVVDGEAPAIAMPDETLEVAAAV